MELVRFGIGLPNQVLPDPRPETMVEMAAEADRLGFDSVWVGDRVFHDRLPILDPLAILASLTTRTSKVRLGTAILIMPLRNPVTLAKTLSTIDFLSKSRLVLGLSVGAREEDYRAVGIAFERRAKLFVDGIELMRKLWTQRDVSYAMEDARAERMNMMPRPAGENRPPILLGGYAEAVFRRAGRLANGWIGGTQLSPEAYASSWNKVVGYAKSLGRDTTKLEPAKLWYCYVSDDRQAAKRLLEERLQTYYGSYDVENNCIFGAPKDCLMRLKKYREAGVRTFILQPVLDGISQVRTIFDEIVAKF